MADRRIERPPDGETPMQAVCLGAHVLDVLAHPVTALPEGQSGILVERISFAPAGTAAGTAVSLAKLGASAHSVGAIGTDILADVLCQLLERRGVDCAQLVRRDGVQTSASVLPIRPNGDRPALHAIGANASYGLGDVPWELIEAADFVHIGAPELLGPQTATAVLEFCRDRRVTTSVDLLADGWPELLDWLAPVLSHTDYLLPNEAQACALTGCEEVGAAARALVQHGPGCVVCTCGADGSLLVTAEQTVRISPFDTHVVDTSGCGDTYSAGFLRGLSLGQPPVEAAALASACASFVAEGLGSDAGDFGLCEALERAAAIESR